MTMQKFRHWAICVFLFLCPIIYSTNPTITGREFQERAFQIMAMCIVALFVGNIWITAFMFLNIFSLLYNDFTVGLPQVLNVFLGAVLFMVSRAYFKQNSFMPYVKVLLWLLALNLIWISLQASGIDPLYLAQDASGKPQISVTFKDFSGLFGIKMANGIFLAIMLPMIAVLNLWLVPLMAVPLFFCRASIVALAVFVSMSFYLFYTVPRKWFLAFLSIGLLAGSIYTYLDLKDDYKTFVSRFPVWHSAVKYTLQRPLGWGPDSYRSYTKQKDFLFYGDSNYDHALLIKLDEGKALFQYYEMDNGKMYKRNTSGIPPDNQLNWWDNPHNEYVQMIFEYGFIGLLILIGFMRDIWFKFRFSSRSPEIVMLMSILIVYAVSGIGHFPMHLARLACLFPVFLGALVGRIDSEKMS